MSADFALPAWCIVGASFRYTASPDPSRHELWHVRSVVDGLAVSRRWSPAKQRWHYEVQDPLCAEVRGARCRVVMASRFGDVGVRFTDFARDSGYSTRCLVTDLSDFSDQP